MQGYQEQKPTEDCKLPLNYVEIGICFQENHYIIQFFINNTHVNLVYKHSKRLCKYSCDALKKNCLKQNGFCY